MTQEEQVAGGNEDEEMKTRAVWEDVFSYPCKPSEIPLQHDLYDTFIS